MKKKLPNLLWFTGLSGSGKTTLANIIYKNLKKYFIISFLNIGIKVFYV